MAPTDHADRKKCLRIVPWHYYCHFHINFSKLTRPYIHMAKSQVFIITCSGSILQKQHSTVSYNIKCIKSLYGWQLISALLHPAGLTENCRSCATQSIQYLNELKSKITLQRADPASVRIIIQKILHLGQVRINTFLVGCLYSKHTLTGLQFEIHIYRTVLLMNTLFCHSVPQTQSAVAKCRFVAAKETDAAAFGLFSIFKNVPTTRLVSGTGG